MLKRLAVVGAGPFFLDKHKNSIVKYGIEVVWVSDLLSKRESLRNEFGPSTCFYWVNDKVKHSIRLPNRTEIKILSSLESSRIDGIMICSEPLSHMMWLSIAFKLTVPIYIEKPLLSSQNVCRTKVGNLIYIRHYNQIFDMINRHCAPVTIGIDRPYTSSYCYYLDKIRELSDISSENIIQFGCEYSTGKNLKKEEYLSMDNHPFKFGYGVLFHSGVHITDMLFRSLLPLNNDNEIVGQFSVCSQSATYQDVENDRICNQQHIKSRSQRGLGEMTINSIIKYKTIDHIATGTMTMTSAGFSIRDFSTPLRDPYLDLSRVRMERYWVDIGCDIKVIYEGISSKDSCFLHNSENVYIYANNRVHDIEQYHKESFTNGNNCYTPLDSYLSEDFESRDIRKFRGSHDLLNLLAKSIVTPYRKITGICNIPK